MYHAYEYNIHTYVNICKGHDDKNQKHDDGIDTFICKSGDKHRQQSSERDDGDIGHRDKQKSL